ncbi:DUF3846 domain-containing protein [Sellimonas caecigallum]|uniref:DUF3846 domain-containing protein n=1 Tax=Sellimonas caecigallum TaxID=2592333 RepID=A0ABS7L705_9FIRM|nr:DUF3846 domain-containing protein [Sellimonas caecigallum]MBY0758552.1 DUF3846 domain-containing protein [Sellimonas caecigallum]
MKTVKVTTDNIVSIINVDFDDYRDIQKAVGGMFETVKTQRLFDYFRQPMMFLCDEEGHLKKLPLNQLGSYFYGTEKHGWPIAGDIIFTVPENEDLLGLENAEQVKEQLLSDFEFLKEE